MPAGTKPPVLQQTKLKAVKKDATKEQEEDAGRCVVENDEQQKSPRALKLEDEEGDAVMTGASEVEEEEVRLEKLKERAKKPTKNDKTGGYRLFPSLFSQD